MAKPEIKLSANFKRDYVAVSAIVLFFLIVAAEVVLAISIPAYLSREDAMAFEVRRIKLLASFDSARIIAARNTPSDPTAAAEMKLLAWELDNLARYLRVNRTRIDSEEVAAIQARLKEIHGLLGQVRRNKPFSQEYKLDSSVYLDRLVPDVGAAPKRGAKKPAAVAPGSRAPRPRKERKP